MNIEVWIISGCFTNYETRISSSSKPWPPLLIWAELINVKQVQRQEGRVTLSFVPPLPSLSFPLSCLFWLVWGGQRFGEGGVGECWGSTQQTSLKCSGSLSQHAPLPVMTGQQKFLREGAKAGRWRLGLVSGGGGWLMKNIECGVGGATQQVGSDAGGRLCSRRLFTVPQTSRLLLVADTHLLRDVNQRARHGQTYTHVQAHTHTQIMCRLVEIVP